jgi:hypothetical protein
MEPDEKRVVCHPKDTLAATALGLNVQASDYCPPGTIYVIAPSKLFVFTDERWQNSVGRISGLGY